MGPRLQTFPLVFLKTSKQYIEYIYKGPKAHFILRVGLMFYEFQPIIASFHHTRPKVL
jgi:hypothetical protein